MKIKASKTIRAGNGWLARPSGVVFRCPMGCFDPSALGRNLGIEGVLTFFLVLVIIAVATDRRVSGAVPALAIGMTVVFDVLIGGPVTGGSMNPARSFGPALFGGSQALGQYWIYAVGPCLGALAAAMVFELLRLEPEHAIGAPHGL